MKIRQGFVSNSSSSSFFAVIFKDDYKSLMEKMNELEVLIFSTMVSEPQKFGDKEVILFSHISGEASYWEPPKGAREIAKKILKEMGEPTDNDYADELIGETYYYITKHIDGLPEHKRIISEVSF
jgi:hypothetical protein